jgi:hypothetical protein
MELPEISTQALPGSELSANSVRGTVNIQHARAASIKPADERAIVHGPGQVPSGLTRALRHINLVSALRRDPRDIMKAEKLGGLAARNVTMRDILQRMGEQQNLAGVVQLLAGHVDAAEEHDYSLNNHPGWKPIATLWAGRTIFTTLQLARPLAEMIKDGISRKSVATFLPHQALSLAFAVGLSRRGSTHSRVVKDHFARRDTPLTLQAACKIFGLYKNAKPVVDHPVYSGFATAFSVLSAILVMFPEDPRLALNHIFRGGWDPRFAGITLTSPERQNILDLRTEAQAALTDLREVRTAFPDKPTESTDLVLSSLEQAYAHVERGTSLLLGEEPSPPRNADRGRKIGDTLITAVITASPLPFLAGNTAALMGVIANMTLAIYVQTKTTLEPTKSKQQSWDNFTKFCAVTAFLGPLFLLNDTKLDNFMEQSNGNALIFAAIFTGIALLTPGLIVNGLTAGAGAGWTYVGKPVANHTVVPAAEAGWKYVGKPVWEHGVRPARLAGSTCSDPL